jgi:hypothetical protein
MTSLAGLLRTRRIRKGMGCGRVCEAAVLIVAFVGSHTLIIEAFNLFPSWLRPTARDVLDGR